MIELLTPAVLRGSTVAKESGSDQIFVSGIVKDATGVDWVKVNGNTVTKIESNGYFSANLKPTETQINIQTANKKGLMVWATYLMEAQAQQKEGEFEIPPIPPEEKPVFHAVLIACSNYDGTNWGKLPSTIKEAQAYKKILQDFYGFNEKNIVELYDKGRREILTALSAKVESMTENDNLIIMFAGHGTFKETPTDMIGYWVPLNAETNFDYISNYNLSEIISACKAKHILMLSDACYSAAMRGKDGNK